MNQEKDLWNIKETADYLGISERTIYNRVRPGTTEKPFPIKPIRIGRLIRFKRADVISYDGE